MVIAKSPTVYETKKSDWGLFPSGVLLEILKEEGVSVKKSNGEYTLSELRAMCVANLSLKTFNKWKQKWTASKQKKKTTAPPAPVPIPAKLDSPHTASRMARMSLKPLPCKSVSGVYEDSSSEYSNTTVPQRSCLSRDSTIAPRDSTVTIHRREMSQQELRAQRENGHHLHRASTPISLMRNSSHDAQVWLNSSLNRHDITERQLETALTLLQRRGGTTPGSPLTQNGNVCTPLLKVDRESVSGSMTPKFVQKRPFDESTLASNPEKPPLPSLATTAPPEDSVETPANPPSHTSTFSSSLPPASTFPPIFEDHRDSNTTHHARNNAREFQSQQENHRSIPSNILRPRPIKSPWKLLVTSPEHKVPPTSEKVQQDRKRSRSDGNQNGNPNEILFRDDHALSASPPTSVPDKISARKKSVGNHGTKVRGIGISVCLIGMLAFIYVFKISWIGSTKSKSFSPGSEQVSFCDSERFYSTEPPATTGPCQPCPPLAICDQGLAVCPSYHALENLGGRRAGWACVPKRRELESLAREGFDRVVSYLRKLESSRGACGSAPPESSHRDIVLLFDTFVAPLTPKNDPNLRSDLLQLFLTEELSAERLRKAYLIKQGSVRVTLASVRSQGYAYCIARKLIRHPIAVASVISAVSVTSILFFVIHWLRTSFERVPREPSPRLITPPEQTPRVEDTVTARAKPSVGRSRWTSEGQSRLRPRVGSAARASEGGCTPNDYRQKRRASCVASAGRGGEDDSPLLQFENNNTSGVRRSTVYYQGGNNSQQYSR